MPVQRFSKSLLPINSKKINRKARKTRKENLPISAVLATFAVVIVALI
jgi:hypothetical protein